MTKQELENNLLSLVKGKRKILILTHENPDPDCIAAAWGLRYIFRKTMGVNTVIAYSGIIGRAENQAMVKLLGIEMVPVSQVNLRNFSVIATVDCQPGTGNLNLPKGVNPLIVIDHHPVRKGAQQAAFSDIRRDVGSTSTIITQYLRLLGLEIDRSVATALYYGIKSDTRDLGRQSTDSDVRATVFLFPHALLKKLARIEHPRLPRAYFVELFTVLKNARFYSDAVVARIDKLGCPEMLGEFADELIQIEGVRWCLCYGCHNGSLLFSIRTVRSSQMAGLLAGKLSHGMGSGGGHETFAAGKIDIAQALKKVNDPEEILVKRFLREIAPRDAEAVNLIPKEFQSQACE